MDWTCGCGWSLCKSGQKAIRGLTADPTQHMPADAVADLWSESAVDRRYSRYMKQMRQADRVQTFFLDTAMQAVIDS